MTADNNPVDIRLPLSVGRIEIARRVFLAPMSGVTDAPFRRLVARLGAGLVISEMTASERLVEGDADACQRLERAGQGPHVVQLAGCEPRWMAEGARIAEEQGADVIDINMGCPARKVTTGYAGSALMRDLDNALTLIEATVAAVSVPVTLKMRLGWDENSINAPELAQRAEAAGVKMITVHGRTRCQFYTGEADWRAIRAVKEVVDIPVVANGDIKGADDAAAAITRSGADAVMVGRAAVGQPWLVGQIADYLESGKRTPPPSLDAQRAMLLELYEDMLTTHGTTVGVRHSRKHLRASIEIALPRGEAGGPPSDLRSQILTSDNPDVVRGSITAFFDAVGERHAA